MADPPHTHAAGKPSGRLRGPHARPGAWERTGADRAARGPGRQPAADRHAPRSAADHRRRAGDRLRQRRVVAALPRRALAAGSRAVLFRHDRETLWLSRILGRRHLPEHRQQARPPVQARPGPGFPAAPAAWHLLLMTKASLERRWVAFKPATELGFPGRFPIVQFPNAPLIIGFLAGAAAAFLHGGAHSCALSVSYLALATWAYEELVHGVNWFRRALGLAFAITMIVRVAQGLHA